MELDARRCASRHWIACYRMWPLNEKLNWKRWYIHPSCLEIPIRISCWDQRSRELIRYWPLDIGWLNDKTVIEKALEDTGRFGIIGWPSRSLTDKRIKYAAPLDCLPFERRSNNTGNSTLCRHIQYRSVDSGKGRAETVGVWLQYFV